MPKDADKAWCTCSHSKPQAFKKQGEDWVCVKCGNPTIAWLKGVTIPRIFLRDSFTTVAQDLERFAARMRARFDQEIEETAKAYDVPKHIIYDLFQGLNQRYDNNGLSVPLPPSQS